MFKALMSWFSTSYSWALYVALATAAFASGWYVSSTIHERDFEAAKADYFAQLQTQEKTFREKENVLQTQVADALAARDTALADASSSRADAVRLRDKADALAKRLSSASGSPCDGCRQSLSKCSRLLGEGVSLAEEGAGMARRDAADIEVMRRALEAE